MSTLSEEKVLAIRELMRKVNVSEVCSEIGIKRRVLYAVLDGESPRVEDVALFEKAAQKEVRRLNKKKRTKRPYNRSI